MPQIKPTSVEDLLKFISDHRSDIEKGIYDILIEDDWVPKIPPETIVFLVKHCPGSRPALGRNINTPMSVLEILARDSEDTIRSKVALNPNASVEILTRLAKDSGPTIRGRVARHPNVTSDILTYLAKDNSSTDITAESFRESICVGMIISDVSVSGIVADNPRSPSNLLAILAKSTDPVTRWLVARNPNTPIDALAILSRDPHNFSYAGYTPGLLIQEAVAKNPKTPPEVLDELSKSDNEDVRDCVASNTRGNVRKAAGGKKGCFIATAVYGSEFEPEVELLRNYRDRVLANYKLGRLFIATYYAISPPVAHFIKPKRWIRNSVRRFILDPIVWIIRISYFR